MNTPRTPKRDDDFDVADVPQFHALVGEVAISWATVEHLLMMLLASLLHVPRPVAEAVFYTVTANKVRREIISNTTFAIFGKDHDLTKRTAKLMDALSKIAKRRNDFAHSIWGAMKKPDGTSVAATAQYWKGDVTITPVKESEVKALIPRMTAISTAIYHLMLLVNAAHPAGPRQRASPDKSP